MSARTYSAREIADEYGMTPRWWRQQAVTGKVPAYRFGRSWRFARDVVEAFRTQQQPPAEPAASPASATGLSPRSRHLRSAS